MDKSKSQVFCFKEGDIIAVVEQMADGYCQAVFSTPKESAPVTDEFLRYGLDSCKILSDLLGCDVKPVYDQVMKQILQP